MGNASYTYPRQPYLRDLISSFGQAQSLVKLLRSSSLVGYLHRSVCEEPSKYTALLSPFPLVIYIASSVETDSAYLHRVIAFRKQLLELGEQLAFICISRSYRLVLHVRAC